MRKIKNFEIAAGMCLLLCAMLTGIAIGFSFHFLLPYSEYRSLCVISGAIIGFIIANLTIARIFVETFPFPIGEIPAGTKAEQNYNIYVFQTFWVIIPLNRCGLIPVPMSGLFYRWLGAKIGAGTFTSGTILDPHLVTIGRGSLLGFGSLLVPHSIEGSNLSHHPICIGSQVTVGAQSIVMGGAVIGDRAVVAMNSVVTKGTHIGADQVWGGTPARLLKKCSSPELGHVTK